MTPLPKKRTRKPRVVAPVELPKTPDDMDKLLGITVDDGAGYLLRNEENNAITMDARGISKIPDAIYELDSIAQGMTNDLVGDGVIGDVTIITELRNEMGLSPHAIWYNIFRYLFTKGRNFGGELHLNRPFIRRVQTLLGKQWEDMSQADKDFILGMMKELPK